MDRATFWDLVDRSREGADGDLETQTAQLISLLDEVPEDQLAAFDAEFVAANRDLYTWEVLGAGTVLLGWLSDDVFTDFRSWVVAQGREVHERVVADPDSLADLGTLDLEQVGLGELFANAAGEAYESRTDGDWFEDFPDQPIPEPDDEPAGIRFDAADADELRRRYPRLTARWRISGDPPGDRTGRLPDGLLDAERALLSDDDPHADDDDGRRPPVSAVLADAVKACGLSVAFVSETSTDPRHRTAQLLTEQGPALMAEVETFVDDPTARDDVRRAREAHTAALADGESVGDLGSTQVHGFRRTGDGITLVRAARGSVVVEVQVSAYLPDPTVPTPTADEVADRLLARFSPTA